MTSLTLLRQKRKLLMHLSNFRFCVLAIHPSFRRYYAILKDVPLIMEIEPFKNRVGMPKVLELLNYVLGYLRGGKSYTFTWMGTQYIK